MFRKIASISLILLFLTTSYIHSEKASSPSILKENPIELMNITFESNNYTLYGEIYYPSNQSETYPGIVFCEGFAGYAEAYNWIPKALAEQGYVVLFFDFPGQGRSEGIFGNKSISIPSLNFYLRFSPFFEVVFHYARHEFVQATIDAITYLTNESPLRNLVNSEKLGLIGHSMGSIVVTATAAYDTRIDAVVALSQGSILYAKNVDVPIQFQAGCFDITFSIPITYLGYKNANPPKELVTIQYGTHIGFTAAFGKYCLCPPWQKTLCLRYAIGWFDYFLKNKPEAYENITHSTDRLSKIYRSRYNFGDGEHFF
ncbi:MAG: alpha/beta fold hydrolase [Candidatus Thermoplasmatota archaeon]|nr:alpha/beta fold hydrolase [Candidatus Thermoplasmatota archaeon]